MSRSPSQMAETLGGLGRLTELRQRLLFVGIALVLRNVWVWLHFQLAKGKWSAEPQLFLELLRFSEFLLWITQVVQRLLRADQNQGIDYETYERVTANA